MVTSLSAAATAALATAALTYPEAGATADTPPPGYRHFVRTRRIPGSDLRLAGTRLLAWQAHERAGLRVAASAPAAEPGAVVLMRLGVGPIAVRIPCRVVYVIDETDRIGFAYGTLPGHPESGEERFLLQRDDLGQVAFTVSAFSRPATALARAGGPVTRWAQDLMTDRYLRALDG